MTEAYHFPTLAHVEKEAQRLRRALAAAERFTPEFVGDAEARIAFVNEYRARLAAVLRMAAPASWDADPTVEVDAPTVKVPRNRP